MLTHSLAHSQPTQSRHPFPCQMALALDVLSQSIETRATFAQVTFDWTI